MNTENKSIFAGKMIRASGYKNLAVKLSVLQKTSQGSYNLSDVIGSNMIPWCIECDRCDDYTGVWLTNTVCQKKMAW